MIDTYRERNRESIANRPEHGFSLAEFEDEPFVSTLSDATGLPLTILRELRLVSAWEVDERRKRICSLLDPTRIPHGGLLRLEIPSPDKGRPYRLDMYFLNRGRECLIGLPHICFDPRHPNDGMFFDGRFMYLAAGPSIVLQARGFVIRLPNSPIVGHFEFKDDGEVQTWAIGQRKEGATAHDNELIFIALREDMSYLFPAGPGRRRGPDLLAFLRPADFLRLVEEVKDELRTNNGSRITRGNLVDAIAKKYSKVVGPGTVTAYMEFHGIDQLAVFSVIS